MQKDTVKLYFTFGSDPAYPFGPNDYVTVEAPTGELCVALFQAAHPNRPGSNAVNCAFWYTEKSFAEFKDRLYPGDPIEEITMLRWN